MSHTHLPRPLFIFLFIMIFASFIVGVFRAFTTARAVSIGTLTPTSSLILVTASITPQEFENETLGSALSVTPTSQTVNPVSDVSNPSPSNGSGYATDMTGIIAMGILMVFVILVGMAWGEMGFRKKKEPKK